ncbi:electron transfer flavoprotein subunit alpha/FixB family protein [Marinobacter nanhaiticus D15-8W]|uniref:Electron transfer flavoprotein subunit alpha/FixB family protein n=1 Tax=Marinobacter nanhaiticus D15-8W TaxID=626887 RepID=N6VV19_9GAMM|nr:electron transfer flavoprotein subunit alpha/FixB family protein [Marinobacter nanhaiticus]ENO14025.1 electron transfer flavoprotein subunit alpha/FixB family protein [Marinobacter nanhaiticus D15-8W]BES71403.1 electron transfer flavoprotein subunit alpha/FixB family protein [Marinobacter nanhaiticus D15-8W]
MNDVPRRNPRNEWILRNRLHVQHDELVAAETGPVRGPTGLLRKNPHGVGFIGPQGIKRIDRSSRSTPALSGNTIGARGPSRPAEVTLPLHQVLEPEFYIAAVLDLVGGRLTSHDRDVLGQAQQLARDNEGQGAVVAVVLGESRETGFDTAGADRVIHLNELGGIAFDGYCPEIRMAVLEAIELELAPRYWLFPDSVHGGADLGARLAARLGERPAVHAWKVDREQTLCRGGNQLTDWLRPTGRVLLLAEECARPVDETRHEATHIELASISEVSVSIEDLGQVEVDPATIALDEAEFILSAGNGIRDWAQFHEVASALGATEGASRVAVDAGHMPRYRQVGASGTWVSAQVYIAVGISGAIQHLQGIGQCNKVVAINVDEGCDMVRRADLSVIGDSYTILEALLQLTRAHRQSASSGATSPTVQTDEEARHVA